MPTKKSDHSGEKPPEQRWCRKEACEIQYCLARQDHQEEKCQHKIDEWKVCAGEARKRDAESRQEVVR
jgi:hypothetical protein